MRSTVIQDLCLAYECEAAQASGAERGRCDCPCHDMTSAEIGAFLRLALPADSPVVGAETRDVDHG